MRSQDAFQIVQDELFLDGNARQNLATFCQTWEEEEIHKLMDLSISKNMIDKDEYPQTAELEMRCVNMLASLWNAPHFEENATGTSTIGSSEACMLGGMAALWRWRAKRRANGLSTDKPNFVCGPVQVCWHKFARYWDVEIRELPMEPGQYCMDAKRMIEHVDENTIMVMPTFGVTYSGSYEFPEAMQDELDALQKRTGLDIDIHVDGASGAFLAPFCAPEIPFDFRLSRVKSISTSGHKFGLAPLGSGWIVWRDESSLPSELVFKVNYLGGEMPTFAINFSRPAGQIISQYYLFLRLGFEGYKKVQSASYRTAQWLKSQIDELGPFEFICTGDPKTGIPAVCWRVKEGAEVPYTLFDLSDRLRTRGWQIPAYTMPANIPDVAVCRILVRRDVSRDMASLLIQDMKNAIAHFDTHPIVTNISPSEGTMYHH
ncbi:MAG: glutamate decarboxylase [Flavobacterium sp.]